MGDSIEPFLWFGFNLALIYITIDTAVHNFLCSFEHHNVGRQSDPTSYSAHVAIELALYSTMTGNLSLPFARVANEPLYAHTAKTGSGVVSATLESIRHALPLFATAALVVFVLHQAAHATILSPFVNLRRPKVRGKWSWIMGNLTGEFLHALLIVRFA